MAGGKMKQGFTLVELIVVIAIIAILAAVIAPNAFRAIEKAKVAKVETDLKTFKTAALSYYSDTGQWPVDGATWLTAEETAMFISGAGQPTGWDGPYLERWPDPPWHCNFVYGGVPMVGTYDWDHWPTCAAWGMGGGDTTAVAASCIPQTAATMVDQHQDDGNLASGRARFNAGYAGGFLNVIIVGCGS
ncbi:MAG TPA: prepilin-type N-terminal cleavage/methylation domain-containing protein [Candidatus Omnitrophota bacterium]|nr:prepilin-type N-terminal cleavage/methylation domain-containing protein [Candidatus Omnitrophota bacterium]